MEGFDLNAVDYLLKPVSFERFLKAVNKVMQVDIVAQPDIVVHAPLALQHVYMADAFIYLRVDRKNIKFYLKDILFTESLKDYIKIVTREKTTVTKLPISSLEETLPPASFMRIHRSFIVSLNKIESYTKELLQVDKYELPVSRSYRN